MRTIPAKNIAVEKKVGSGFLSPQGKVPLAEFIPSRPVLADA
jgi:hypothetical protein